MSTPIRIFNEQGIAAFQALLQQYREGYVGPVPDVLLSDGQTSYAATPAVNVEPMTFVTKGDAARTLVPLVQRLRLTSPYQHRGLWAWLSAYYFDSVCPPRDNDTRNVGAEYQYILEDDTKRRNFSRSLLAMPCRVLVLHSDGSPRFIMDERFTQGTTLSRELGYRHDIINNSGVLQAADILFWDAARRRPKPGISAKDGNIERFVAVINQLDLTYDLQSMSGEEIIALLPAREFGHWLEASPA